MPNPRAADNLTAHRFQPGQSGNPGGKTSAQRRAELEAAEKAAKLQHAMLDALLAHVQSDPGGALAAIRMDALRLIKDAMDRGFGSPVQAVDHVSSGRTMTPPPTLIQIVAVEPERRTPHA